MAKLKKVKKLDQIKEGDTIVMSGDNFKNEVRNVETVKISEDGTEIIFDNKNNKYFNLGMYLKGESWVKELSILN